jgi:signal transduction histidine kinase
VQVRSGAPVDPQAFFTEDSLAHRSLIASAGGRVGAALGILFGIVALVSDVPTGWRLLGLAGAAITAGAGLGLQACSGRIPIRAMDALSVCGVSVILLGGALQPQYRTVIPAVLLVFGMVQFAIRRWQSWVFHVVIHGVGYALVITTSPRDEALPARWVAVMAAVASSGLFVRWLVDRIRELIVEEQEARAAADAAAAELRTVDEAKSAFLARMSHELRTPLNAVLGFADVLRDGLAGSLGDRERGYVDDIADSGRHLLALVDDVLDLSAVESGVLELKPEPCEIGPLLHDAARMVRERSQRAGVEVRVEDHWQGGEVAIDVRRIRQVLVNLLDNAVRFTPSGGSVVLRSVPDVRTGALRIDVRDTGIGIAAEHLERIFGAYQQVEDRRDGTGLGLALARHIAELHGGSLQVDSRPGVGSTFTLALPLRPAVHRRRPVVDDATEGVSRPRSGDAFLDRGSAANGALIGAIGAAFCLVAGAVGPVVALLAPGTLRARLAVVLLCLAAAASVPLQRRMAQRLTSTPVDAIGGSGILMIAGMSAFDQPLDDVLPLLYAWVIGVSFALWSTRRGLLQIIAVGVAHGAVLLVKGAGTPELVHWIGTMAMVLITGAIVNWLAEMLRAIARSEREARLTSEAMTAELAAASQHKSDFLAGMSHELRTPLNAIIGFSDVLLEPGVAELTDQQRSYVADIADAGRHLLALINDILDLAKLQAGRLELRVELVAVPALVEEVLAGVRAEASRRQVALAADVDADLPLVTADPGRLEQALSKLVSNAVHFTGAGGRVEIAATHDDERLRLEVRDTGRGVAPEDRGRIFEAFQQAEPGGERGEGAGLGLAVAEALVQLHGGEISLESEPDRGSTFTVHLPLPMTAAELAEVVS